MKALLPELDPKSLQPLYLQLFEYIKTEISTGDLVPGEKLPSLRNLSDSLEVSLTTVSLAYEQLVVEGYVYSEPKRGYFVGNTFTGGRDAEFYRTNKIHLDLDRASASDDHDVAEPGLIPDSTFDFIKWKKCVSSVLNETPESLLTESAPQGEQALREQVARYVYTSRGVRATQEQVFIAAGTQQITAHLSTLLRLNDIELVALEDPGYQPVASIFRDRGFAIKRVPVAGDGISIEKLPANIRSAAYVAPSNQFPTGAMMPILRRHQLLSWARENDSYIIEDDYDSELRYFGRPAPAMQGLDNDGRVIYLGSFSSTLFAAIKISYMILPPEMSQLFAEISSNYTQSCSKTEQLALALFMKKGFYQTGIKKMRRSYSKKLQVTLEAFRSAKHVDVRDTHSGTHVILETATKERATELCEKAQALSLPVYPLSIHTASLTGDKASPSYPLESTSLIFYYTRLAIDDIAPCVEKLTKK